MIGAVILTFVITSLAMLVLFLLDRGKKCDAEQRRMNKENEGLRRQIQEYAESEQARRVNSAYDRGLYDGRATDTYYRQCLKKFTGKEQAEIMLNGDEAEMN